jgi:hypothetical protein
MCRLAVRNEPQRVQLGTRMELKNNYNVGLLILTKRIREKHSCLYNN